MRRPTTRITANLFMGRFVRRKFPTRQRLWCILPATTCAQPVIKPQPLSWDAAWKEAPMFGAQPAADVAFFARGAALLESGYQLAPRAGEMDRRDGLKPGNRFLGRVVGCNGSRATIAAVAENGETSLTELWSVGKLVSISVGSNRVVALVYSMQTISEGWGEEASNTFRIEVELMGEVQVGPDGREAFSPASAATPISELLPIGSASVTSRASTILVNRTAASSASSRRTKVSTPPSMFPRCSPNTSRSSAPQASASRRP